MSRYAKQIDDAFVSHDTDTSQREAMDVIRGAARTMAEQIAKYCPESREASTALTKLEESMFHANAGIARHGLKT